MRDSPALITAGDSSVIVKVVAHEPGAAANGLVPGQINQLIDPVAYIASTANVTASLLGSDVEGDERYRARIRQAPEAFSCAGPKGAYEYYALAAHPDISAVAIWTPVPGTVDVRPVMAGGELPPPDVLETVCKFLNADDVRPLTDTVTVQAPELVYFDISLTWYLSRDKQSLLASLLERAGVKRIELAAPAYRKLEGWQLAREASIAVTYGGLED